MTRKVMTWLNKGLIKYVPEAAAERTPGNYQSGRRLELRRTLPHSSTTQEMRTNNDYSELKRKPKNARVVWQLDRHALWAPGTGTPKSLPVLGSTPRQIPYSSDGRIEGSLGVGH